MKLRFAMILSLVLALFVYVGWTLEVSFGAPLAISIMVFLFAGLLFYRKFHSLKNRRLRLFLVNAVHLEMGFLSFLLTWIVVRDLIFIPLGKDTELSAIASSGGGTLAVFGLSLLTLLIGVSIASAGPWVVKVSIEK